MIRFLTVKRPFLLLIWLLFYFINYSFSLNLFSKCSAKNMTLSRRSFYHHKEKKMQIVLSVVEAIYLWHVALRVLWFLNPGGMVSLFLLSWKIWQWQRLWQLLGCSNWLEASRGKHSPFPPHHTWAILIFMKLASGASCNLNIENSRNLGHNSWRRWKSLFSLFSNTDGKGSLLDHAFSQATETSPGPMWLLSCKV